MKKLLSNVKAKVRSLGSSNNNDNNNNNNNNNDKVEPFKLQTPKPAPAPYVDTGLPIHSNGVHTQSLLHTLCFDELDDSYVEVVFDVPPDLSYSSVRLGFIKDPRIKNGSPVLGLCPGSVALDLIHGRLSYCQCSENRLLLQFDQRVRGFECRRGDVVGLGVDDKRQVYVTINGKLIETLFPVRIKWDTGLTMFVCVVVFCLFTSLLCFSFLFHMWD
jgi:hypothetical protein